MYKEVFGIRMYARRKELDLTQGGVAVDTEIGQSKISKYENGNLEPDLETLGKLANYYQVSIDWLLGNPHNGKEGNIVKAALEEFFNDVVATIEGAAEQKFTRDEEREVVLAEIYKTKEAIIKKYADNKRGGANDG